MVSEEKVTPLLFHYSLPACLFDGKSNAVTFSLLEVKMRIPNKEVESKIIAAAEELYLELGKLPSIDRVRRRARAGMWVTVGVMRDWRRAKSGQQEPPSILTNRAREQAWAEAAEEIAHLREELDLARANIETMVPPWPDGFDENTTLEELYQNFMAEADLGGK